jgi:hypothetical protein
MVILIFTAVPVSAMNDLPITDSSSTVINFDETTTDDSIALADVLVIKYDDISMISDKAKSIVDEGKLIYITSPQTSAEEISKKLSIPKQGISTYNREALVAFSIFKADNLYVFQGHYVTIGEVADRDNLSNETTLLNKSNSDSNVLQEKQLLAEGESTFDVVTTIKESDSNLVKIASESVDVAIESMKTTIEQLNAEVHNLFNESIVVPMDTSWPTTSVSRMYSDTLSVYDNSNKYYGYVKGTVKVYDLGRMMVNNKNQFLYNVVTRVEVYPQSTVTVKEYKTRIHCNIVGHTMLETASLPSGISYSEGITLQGSYSSTDGAGGLVSYSTQWSYNPESQKITRSSSQDRVVDWTAKTVSATKGKSYDLAPGMTVASTGSTGQRGAYSMIYCDALTLFNIVLKTNSLEIGGWF